MTKTLLIAGAVILVVYILTSSNGGKLFQLAPTTRLTPKTPAPKTSGPGTRYTDANAWSVAAAAAPSAISLLGKIFGGGSSSSSSSSAPSVSPYTTGNPIADANWNAYSSSSQGQADAAFQADGTFGPAAPSSLAADASTFDFYV